MLSKFFITLDGIVLNTYRKNAEKAAKYTVLQQIYLTSQSKVYVHKVPKIDNVYVVICNK